jgi:hypothetical protein
VCTITTVGYGDTYPTTAAGKLVMTSAMIVGLMVLALPITIMGGSFAKQFELYNVSMRHDNKALARTQIQHLQALASASVAGSDEKEFFKARANAARIKLARTTPRETSAARTTPQESGAAEVKGSSKNLDGEAASQSPSKRRSDSSSSSSVSGSGGSGSGSGSGGIVVGGGSGGGDKLLSRLKHVESRLDRLERAKFLGGQLTVLLENQAVVLRAMGVDAVKGKPDGGAGGAAAAWSALSTSGSALGNSSKAADLQQTGQQRAFQRASNNKVMV